MLINVLDKKGRVRVSGEQSRLSALEPIRCQYNGEFLLLIKELGLWVDGVHSISMSTVQHSKVLVAEASQAQASARNNSPLAVAKQ